MGTLLGDALAKKGLVDQKKADEAAKKMREEKERRVREAAEAEERALKETGKPEVPVVPDDWAKEDDR